MILIKKVLKVLLHIIICTSATIKNLKIVEEKKIIDDLLVIRFEVNINVFMCHFSKV